MKLKPIGAVAVLAIAAVSYKLFLQKSPPDMKVHGEVYVLPKDFVLNLKDGRYVKLGVGLVVAHGQELAGHEGATPPEGYGTLPQEALIRDIVTDALTDTPAERLMEREDRGELKHLIARRVNKRTDVEVEDVLFTDVAVQ